VGNPDATGHVVPAYPIECCFELGWWHRLRDDTAVEEREWDAADERENRIDTAHFSLWTVLDDLSE
jgi:hypothetical protein